MEPPRCFISYSWDSNQHRDWVRKLATRLRECGVDAILDQFECAPGMDLTQFMEKSVRESNFVLLICTPNFARKADAKVGGVGYEKQIITGEMFSAEAQETKFVPVLREGDAKDSLPSYLMSRFFVDLRDDDSFETKLDELLRHFYDEPLYSPPPLGHKPDWKTPTISEPVSESTVSRPAKKPSPQAKPLDRTLVIELRKIFEDYNGYTDQEIQEIIVLEIRELLKKLVDPQNYSKQQIENADINELNRIARDIGALP